ncbi:MAG: 50S ribosomal protein L9 [Muribaculaceae bacterium]|nr:50S ribosomal protein L9 [Muribaculaceae bacterium]MDE6316513.1 50S ribosomal protein L9 [Muribaculaceae bacterium]
MKLILIEDVPNLGYKDDVVEVKSGYGRNYLIPQQKAVIATPSALKVLAENQRQRAHKLAQIKAEAEAAAAALAGVALTIAAKTAASGTIYGAVNAASVAEALEKLGHNVDRKLINLKDVIKEVGNYTATIKFHRDVTVEIPVEVVAEVTAEA